MVTDQSAECLCCGYCRFCHVAPQLLMFWFFFSVNVYCVLGVVSIIFSLLCDPANNDACDGTSIICGIRYDDEIYIETCDMKYDSYFDIWYCDGECAIPSSSPTEIPTPAPTNQPTFPTITPTTVPTFSPTQIPTQTPSNAPTGNPTLAPTPTTAAPTFTPSQAPTITPSNSPSKHPSTSPSQPPTIAPSSSPIMIPTATPSHPPSRTPSASPSQPTATPSDVPSTTPTQSPSNPPTTAPSDAPNVAPSNVPTITPSAVPSISPSLSPTAVPSNYPSQFPSDSPTNNPTVEPSNFPLRFSSIYPSQTPTHRPTTARNRKSDADGIVVVLVVVLLIVVIMICIVICFKKYKIVKQEEKSLTFASVQTPTTHHGEIEVQNVQGNHNGSNNEDTCQSNQELYPTNSTNGSIDDSLTPSDDKVEIHFDVEEKGEDKDKAASLSETESGHDESLFGDYDLQTDDKELEAKKTKNINAGGDDDKLQIEMSNDEFNHELQTDIDANMGGQIEGLTVNDAANGARTKIHLDINNWKEWDKNEINEWIRETLKRNKIDDDEVNQFMSNVFEKMNLTGRIIMALKTNNQYWKKFQNDIQNYSLGIWIAIDGQIQGLPTDYKGGETNNKFHD